MGNFKTYLTRSRCVAPARSALCLKYGLCLVREVGREGEKGIKSFNVLSCRKAKNWNSLLTGPFEFLVQIY